MLFADEPPATWVQALAAVATTLVGAWMTVKLHRIDREARRVRHKMRAEKARCDGLEVRVEELEKALSACQRARARKRK